MSKTDSSNTTTFPQKQSESLMRDYEGPAADIKITFRQFNEEKLKKEFSRF